MAGTPPTTDPAFFSELFPSIEYETDGFVQTSRRSFRVPAIGKEAVFYPGMPSLNSEHPRCPGLRCDRLVCGERLDQYSSKVEALYSVDGRFRSVSKRPENDTTRGYLNMDPERADMSVPFFVATKRRVPKYTSNPATGAQVLTGVDIGFEWLTKPLKTTVNRTIISREVTLTAMSGSTIAIINKQVEQIHLIPNGESWQMIAPSVRQTGINLWKVSYQWRKDVTTPVPGKPVAPIDPEIPATVLAAYYITANAPRPPFYAYQVIPSAFTITLSASGIEVYVPEVRVFDRFPDNRNNADNPSGLGWVNLPGAPLDEYV